jgi:arylsulfatase A-like enzyme
MLHRIAVFAVFLFAAGCGRAPEVQVLRLVDVFDTAKIEGSPRGNPLSPGALWDFTKPPAAGGDPLLGWKAGPGVSGLRVVNGKLTGRSTTDFPVLYVSRPKTVDPNDAFDSLNVRIRVSGGANISATGTPGAPDFPQVMRMAGRFPWPVRSPLPKKDGAQTLKLASQQVTRMTWQTLLLRPTDAAGATFEIESIHAISQRERRAAIRSGVGWQGLSDIYHETIVSRSPEKFTLELDVPENAWLDLNVGTLEDHPVTFKVAAVSGGRERLLLERTVTTTHRWEPAAIDLSGSKGKTALRFWLEVPDERSIGFWGSPVIRVRGRRLPAQQTAAAALGGVEPPQGVILILCDTLRKDHLTMYGHHRDTSPNLARLASQGATFLDAVSQATWTKVSTPSILTSLHPSSHQVLDFTHQLSANAETLAEVYRRAGYATVAYSSVLFTGKFTNLHQGFEELHESTSAEDPKYHSKTARTYVDRATAWLERHRDVPFFMLLHVFDPHDPFEPRAPYDSLWADPARKEVHEKQLAAIRKVIEDPLLQMFGMPSRAEIEKAGVSPEEYVAYDKDWYDGSILGMDAEVARLVERVRQLGLEHRVQIAFTSDHGEEFIEHGRMFHGQTVYGELSGVPLVLYRPGVIPAGARIPDTVRSIDIMPTLLDLTGLPVPKQAQGQSLVPLLAAARAVQANGNTNTNGNGHANGAPPSVAETARAFGWHPQPAVTERAFSNEAGGPPPRGVESYGIVFDVWKLVHNARRTPGMPEFELYNHLEDPLNKHDVAAKHPEVVARLRDRLVAWRQMVSKTKIPNGAAQDGMSSKDLERLRSLGYIQ